MEEIVCLPELFPLLSGHMAGPYFPVSSAVKCGPVLSFAQWNMGRGDHIQACSTKVSQGPSSVLVSSFGWLVWPLPAGLTLGAIY